MLTIKSFTKFALGFISGAVLGAVLALLFAPESGSELRHDIHIKAEDQWHKATEKYQQLVKSDSAADEASDVEAIVED
jgi:gas vesicle protein